MIDINTLMSDALVELAEKGETNVTIKTVLRIGSSIFISDATDADYLFVVEGLSVDSTFFKLRYPDMPRDCIVSSLDYKNRSLRWETNDNQRLFNIQYLFGEVVYGELTETFDLFGHQEEYKQLMKEYLLTAGFHPRGTVVKPMFKRFALPYIGLKMLENNSTAVTAAIKEGVRRIYKGENIDDIVWIGQKLGMELHDRIKAHYNLA